MGSNPETRVWLVHGLVQGVGFRWFVNRQAERLGVRGWVANRRDGSVEVLAHGSESTLRVLLEALRRGPSAARVERVEQLAALRDVAVPNGFEIR
jgi:acylphosphatase